MGSESLLFKSMEGQDNINIHVICINIYIYMYIYICQSGPWGAQTQPTICDVISEHEKHVGVHIL